MKRLIAPLCFLLASWIFVEASASEYSVIDFGAQGDGEHLDTPAINQAIKTASESGGGRVVIPPGDYLCYSIRLMSNITLYLAPGSRIIAADPPAPGETGGFDAPEPNPSPQYQDFGHSHWHNSLIWGGNLENVTIEGPGLIYGRGLSRGNGRIASPVGAFPVLAPGSPLPDVLAADGLFDYPERTDLIPGPFGYPNARDTLPDGVGNKAIALKNCRNVIFRDFRMLHGGHFAILVTGVDNLIIDNLLIDTNRDGIDIDACSNVRVTRCSINSPWDDALCLKASHGLGYNRPTETVTISDCMLSGYDEGTLLDGTRTRSLIRRGGPMGRIKLGTEAGGGFRNITIANCVFDYCRGIALEQVDGSFLEDITISNITMRDVQNAPIFIRLGARLRNPQAVGPGSVQRILIDNLVASNVAPEHGILMSGLPGHPIKDVTLSNIQIHYRGGGTAEQSLREVPELAKAYPDPWEFGTIPSWGIFARNMRNLQIHNVELRVTSLDLRPAVLLEDVQQSQINHLRLTGARDPERPTWSLRKVEDLKVHEATGLPNGVLPEVGAKIWR